MWKLSSILYFGNVYYSVGGINLPPITWFSSNSFVPLSGKPSDMIYLGTYTLYKFPLSVCHPVGRFIASVFKWIS